MNQGRESGGFMNNIIGPVVNCSNWLHKCWRAGMVKVAVLFFAVVVIDSGTFPPRLSYSETILPPSEYWSQITKKFQGYWYQGAEVSRFQLEQARYGELHKGDAILIFVTEDFLTDKQVKSEIGKSPVAVPILKLNLVRKFNTGIYPYSIMSSIFTPVNRPKYFRSLKATTSIQEWCGHTYTQFNLRNNEYNVLVHSYFMDEADQHYTLASAQLEDEIWTLIRMDPQSLETGNIELIPGSQFSRLKRINQKVQKATASLTEDNNLNIYSIEYNEIPRKLTIKFKKAFPYEIMAWEEISSRDKGPHKKVLTTRAMRTHIMLIDYWNKNSVADSVLRERLGLEVRHGPAQK